MPDLDLAKAFDNHITAARALPADEVLPFRLDINLAVVNVTTGMQVVEAHAADIPKHLPQENLQNLLSLNELAAAVKYAVLGVEQEAPEPSEIKAKQARARELRNQAMPVAKGLAANDALPQAELDPILAGRGPFDTAEDCVSLAKLFRKHEVAIAGKHPLKVEPRGLSTVSLLVDSSSKGTPESVSVHQLMTAGTLDSLAARRFILQGDSRE